MKVGDKVWIKDENNRIYVDDDGVRHSSPIYRKKFVEKYIIGETRISWIIADSMDWDVKRGQKIKKEVADRVLYVSEEEVNQHCWVVDNRHNITEKLRLSYDYKLWKTIEGLLNENQ